MSGSENRQSNAIEAARTAPFYDEFWTQFGRNPNAEELSRRDAIVRALALVRKHAPIHTILDLGCGRGWLAPHLAPWGRVVGTDYSEAGLQAARQNYGDVAEFVRATEGYDELRSKASIGFSVVVASEVIEHVRDHREFLLAIRSLLAPGGWILLTTPNGRLWQRYRADPRNAPYIQPIENWLTPTELSELVRESGYRVVVHEGIVHPSVRYGVGRFLEARRLLRLVEAVGLRNAFYRQLRWVSLNQLILAQDILR